MPVPPLLKSRVVWAGAIVAGLVGLYALLGFKVAPGIVRDQAIKFVRENYGRELAVGEIRVHPFKLQLEVRDLAVPDTDGKPMVGFSRFFVDFELASLWQRTFIFRELTLEALRVQAVVRPDGSLNLADLALPEDPEKEDTGLPALWLQSFTVANGAIDYVDLSRRVPFERKGKGATFTLKDFRTTSEGGNFSFSARTGDDESVDWKGSVVLEPEIASQGEFKLGNVSAPGVAEFLGDALPFVVSSGLVQIAGTYRMSLADELSLDLQLPQVEATGTKLRARGSDADWIEIPSVVVSGTSVALPKQAVTVSKIAVAGLKVQAWMSPDGSINIQQLFAPSPAAPATAGVAAPEPAGTSEKTAADAPTLGIASIELTDASIDFEDRSAEPARKFAVAPLNLTLRDASLDLAKPVPMTLSATINGHALLGVDGTVTPDPLAADLDVSLEKAHMDILQPYVLPVADLTITGGTLGVKGKARLEPAERPGPDLSFTGDVTIDGFKSVDNTLKQDFVNFRRLELQKLRFDLGPDALSIDRVLVNAPYARVIISKDQIVNIAAVLDPEGTAAALEARRAAAAAEAAMTPAEKKRREKELEAQEEAAAKARKQGVAKAAAPPPAAPEPDTFPVRVREVRIDGGEMNFSDYFVQPNFSAKVQDLRGTIRGISSAFDSRARVDLKGSVGEFSPVSIAGELQPFAFDHYTDIGLDFENISLPVFNPYSGRFAGYNIAKGKLTTALHYTILDRKLDATHKIRIDQLEWGEATDTKSEATLPVKFATALLRDRHGVIDLDVPVSGTLDDPTFRIGPIVWKIIKNIIVKVVAAPFSFLGSLFEGAEEAQFVDFAPGDAALPAATVGGLASLSRGLVEKPGIKLEVPIGAVAELDRPAMAERAYQRQLAAAMSVELRRRDDDATPLPAFDTLEAQKKIDVLEALLKNQGGPVPEVPEPPAPPEGTSRAEARALREAAEIAFLEKEVRGRIVVTDADLEALGQERAASIERALLTGSELEPTRVFLSKNGKVSTTDGRVRFELGLD